MRLRERDKKDVTLHAFAGVEEDRYTYLAGEKLRAAVYPVSREGSAQVYGERIEETRVMLCDADVFVDVGMGVCVESTDGKPDFRVISVEKWAHTRAVLERIPEEKRG